MKVITAVKRPLASLAFIAATAALFAAVSLQAKQPCPLASEGSTATTSSNDASMNARSPEQAPPANYTVQHNNQTLCLPEPAARAHQRHGDPIAPGCAKPGNQS